MLLLTAPALAQQPPFSPSGTVLGFTIGTSSTPVLSGSTIAQPSPPPVTRRVLWLHNPSQSATIWCAFGKNAVVSGPGTVILPPQSSILWGNAGSEINLVPGDALNCIASAGSSPLTVEVY